MEDLLDEDVGATDNRSERDEKLYDDGRHGRRVAACRVHDERLQLLGLADGPAVSEGPRRVDRVRDDEDDRAEDLKRERCAEPEQERDDEAGHEEREVARERREMDVEREILRASPAVGDRGQPDERHRDRREKERSADDGADGHVLRAGCAADDGDDRNQRFG
ncbi:MAG: hypothetical protein M5U27_10250 [Gaiella sp.]|nr:hypothetical protein [Gaiella sp.]